jgi:hypothetical protein
MDWEKAYENFTGIMDDCHGINCPSSCCNLKTAPTWGHGLQQFNTTLEPDEYVFQIQQFGQIEDLGVETYLADLNTERGSEHFKYLIRECMARDGDCKLKHRKPMQCRLFPFSTSAFMPLRADCSRAKIIGRVKSVQNGIQTVREALGHLDNAEWLAALEKKLEG